MILDFPTGSKPNHSPKQVVANISFVRGGSWAFDPKVVDPNDPDLVNAMEAVEFFTFCISSRDVIEMFHEYNKNKIEETIDDWRRDNIRLVEEDDDASS